MNHILIAIAAYTIGSFPTAYLVTKYFFHKDIREEGTGNVGGMNVYDVTQSKAAGITVAALDLAKGLAAVALGVMTGNVILAAIVVVAGHLSPVWLMFRGGRGLATAAGALILLAPVMIAVWCVVWFGAKLFRLSIFTANIIATCSLFFVWIIPGSDEGRLACTGITILILFAHRKKSWRSGANAS